jgi:transcriptional regulator with XRE-family HTH domain
MPVNPVDEAIGRRLRQVRKAAGLSMAELGKRLSPAVAQQQISKFETGVNRLSALQIIQLCQSLDVRPGQLLGVEAPADPREEEARQIGRLVVDLPPEARSAVMTLVRAVSHERRAA